MDKGDMSGSAANGSSDFVRKLYKMLEDPSHEHVVRWGNEGDSFVVLENEKFTKTILPKHFKHSNFASFVRQLNKYDFHKVRQSNEDTGPSQYGHGVWEFKHPEFQANKKDSLDNIRRKAPAPRKVMQTADESFIPVQQMDLVNTQLVATQQQLQHLQQRYDNLCQGHRFLSDQVVFLQKVIKAHDEAMRRFMGFLQALDTQRRNSGSVVGEQFNNGDAAGMEIGGMIAPASDDPPASPLQEASQLLGQYSSENLVSKELEQIARGYGYISDYTTPPQDQANPSLAPGSGGVSNVDMAYDSLDFDLVYPAGRTTGIDPINSEHINNIPYSMPPNEPLVADSGSSGTTPGPMGTVDRKKTSLDPGWGAQKPRVLLVEDDKTCARIGCKLLQMFNCSVETARDGLDAVNVVNSRPHAFDLILMDIIMPMLDGVSATSCIREVNPTVPVVAMTSNIRQDDIEIYFRYGMNGLLPKPFTKDGLLRTLDRFLAHFKKDYQAPQQSNQSDSYASLNLNAQQTSTAHPFKDEPSPGKSSSTSSWHSPTQITNSSPAGTASQNAFLQQMHQGSGQYTTASAHPHGYQSQSQSQSPVAAMNAQGSGSMGGPRADQGQGPARSGVSGSQRRTLNEMAPNVEEQKPEKKQRMYPPQGAFS